MKASAVLRKQADAGDYWTGFRPGDWITSINVRDFISAELGPKGIRVHAISPGPLATRAASGIPDFDKLLEKAKTKAPAHRLVSIEDVGAATAFLAHDAARLISGGTIYIDGGYHVVD